MSVYDTFASNHPTTKLHHTLSQTYGCQAYQLLCTPIDSEIIGGKAQVMAGLVIHKDVIAAKMGESGRYATERTSKAANDEFLGLTPKDFKRFVCDCKAEDVIARDVDMGDAATSEHGGVAFAC
jgi:endoribonuclease Dicer